MGRYLAIASFVAAALCFLNGIVTEYRQTRRVGPYAIVPTLPYAVAAAIFVTLGLWFLPASLPWWTYPVGFASALVVCGFTILRANADGKSEAE